MNSDPAWLATFDRIVDGVARLAKTAMLTLTAAIFAIILVTVFSRYVLNFVLSWSEEVPRYLLVWISLIGAALAIEHQAHIGFDYLFNKLPERSREASRILLNLGVGSLGAIMLVYGIDFVGQFGGDWMESIPFTNVWFYTAMPVSGALIVLFVVRQELRGILSFFKRVP